MKKHPSGKPVRSERRGVTSVTNVRALGPLTPRLQQKQLEPAIGFITHFNTDEDE